MNRCLAVALFCGMVAGAMGASAADRISRKETDMPTLDWRNKKNAKRAVSNAVMRILREDRKLSYGKGSDNLLIHGDNLEALKALLPFLAGQVKCIYIDPPYNTGSAFGHYDDNLEHSEWLNIMYPRLQLLRDFLSEDGSIWISIDDREGAYLRVICDEIFGRQNFVATVSWQRTYSKRGDSKGIPVEVERILVYSKHEDWIPNKLPRTAEMDSLYKNPDNDPLGRWQNTSAFAPGGKTHQGMVYAIQHPFTGAMIYPTKEACWRYDQGTMLEIMNGWAAYELRDLNDAEQRAASCGIKVEEVRKGVKAIVLSDSLEEAKKSAQAVMKRGQWPRFYFTSGGKGGIRRKTYLSNVSDGVPASNLWMHEDVGHTDEAKKEVLKVFDGQSPFATPKPERLIQRILTIASNPGDLVMDSFLGSGTTAAVAQKMGRRWVGIEMGDHAKTHCALRLKKVVDGEQGGISESVKWKGGGGFRYYDLGEPILDENGDIRESIPYEVLAAHIWWQETKTAYGVHEKQTTFLGAHENVAYALLYNGILHDRSVGGGNVLTAKTLKIIKDDIGAAEYRKLVIYGEWTKLGVEVLKDEKIEFRQTPYDVMVRK